MKIEMGESLFYSWLRHVKECQVVQTNWKPSRSWQLIGEEELKRFISITDELFQNKYGYGIYKNNSLSQLLTQTRLMHLVFQCQVMKRKYMPSMLLFMKVGLILETTRKRSRGL